MEHRLRPGDQVPDLELLNQVNHDLLSDPDHGSARRWGAWGTKEINGQRTIGRLRSTFVVDEAGQLESVEYDLDAASHVAELGDRLGLTGSPRTASTLHPSSIRSRKGFSCSAESSPAPPSHVGSLSRKESEPT